MRFTKKGCGKCQLLIPLTLPVPPTAPEEPNILVILGEGVGLHNIGAFN
jgi:hypothetical protein